LGGRKKIWPVGNRFALIPRGSLPDQVEENTRGMADQGSHGKMAVKWK